MPDITMCRNERCSIKMSCYRYTVEPSGKWQSYDSFEGEKNCKHFIKNRKIQDNRAEETKQKTMTEEEKRLLLEQYADLADTAEKLTVKYQYLSQEYNNVYVIDSLINLRNNAVSLLMEITEEKTEEELRKEEIAEK